MTANDAVKVDTLCARILGDIGSVYKRTAAQDPEGNPATAMPPELVALRRYIREVQDGVRDAYPNAFFR
jgi:hypothetical protein